VHQGSVGMRCQHSARISWSSTKYAHNEGMRHGAGLLVTWSRWSSVEGGGGTFGARVRALVRDLAVGAEGVRWRVGGGRACDLQTEHLLRGNG
jgi:hypothetical protein